MVTPCAFLLGRGRVSRRTDLLCCNLGDCWAILRTSGFMWLESVTCFLSVFIFIQLEMIIVLFSS